MNPDEQRLSISQRFFFACLLPCLLLAAILFLRAHFSRYLPDAAGGFQQLGEYYAAALAPLLAFAFNLSLLSVRWRRLSSAFLVGSAAPGVLLAFILQTKH
jgi:uncharacterized membrane-anchored protein YitT (DUF2179 family)